MGAGLAGSSRCLLLVALALACRPALANEPTPAGAPDGQAAQPSIPVPPVVVEGKGELPPPEPSVPEDPTGFATVITRERFAGEAVDAADLLLHAPGTMVRRTPGMETLEIRGASPDETLVLLDGIPMAPGAGGGVDLATIPAGLLHSVTVIRGNEGGRFGAGALGGVALLQTEPPSPGSLASSLTLRGGSFQTGSVDATLSGGAPDLSAIAGLELSGTAGNYTTSFDPTPSLDPGDATSLQVTNNHRASAALLLKGQAVTRLGLHVDALVQGFTEDRGLPGTFYAPTPDDRRMIRRGLLGLRASSRTSETLSLDGSAELRREDLAVVHVGAGGLAALPPGDGIWQRDTTFTVRGGARLTPADFTVVDAAASAGVESLASPYHGSPSRPVLAVSLADELYLGRTVTVTPAVRWDGVGSFTGVSPRLGIAWRPVAFLELRSSAGQTFRAPSFGELYLEEGPVRPNLDLRSEHGTMLEAGALVRFPAVNVQVVAFTSQITDVISYEVAGMGLIKPFNFPGAEVDGGEFQADFHPWRWSTVSALYGLARSRNLDPDVRFTGKELPFRPAERAQLRAEARHAGFEGFAEYGWQSPAFTSASNRTWLPTQRSARFGAGVRLTRVPWVIWASGEVDNALDAVLVDQLGFPQPGRAFFLTLRGAPPGAPEP